MEKCIKKIDSSKIILILVIIITLFFMILKLATGQISDVLLCLMSIILLIIPLIVEHRFNITIPKAIKIMIYLFIFLAEILGKINNFYIIIPYWDTILHTICGFLASAFGLSISLSISKKNNMSVLVLLIISFLFSMTIAVLWEFFEYSGDKLFILDSQKNALVTNINSSYINDNNDDTVISIENIGKTVIYDNNDEVIIVVENGYLDLGLNDTIKDMFFNFIGSIIFLFITFVYLKKLKKNNALSNFIIKKDIE